MKKILTFLCVFCFVLAMSLMTSLPVFALTDTDADGVADESDICPRVYARSATGCPTLVQPSVTPFQNTCLNDQLNAGKIIANIVPLCSSDGICPKISAVTGLQLCDPIFPVVFDSSGVVLVRGAVYIYR